MNKKIIVITGMTASGKTNAAIKLAKKLNTSIICADSRIVYKDIDIASAKPSLEEQKGIKHHLVDIVTPDEDFSAGVFVRLSKEIIKNEKSEYIIICGGTWFYIKSLLDKKALIDCPVNQKLRDELNNLSNQELFDKLKKLDIKRSELIHPNNKDKIIRSIEMCLYLNQPLSEYKREENEAFEASWYMLNTERQNLYSKVNQRVDEMIEAGLFEEWQKNKEKYPNSKILQNTIGYSEFFDLENNLYNSFDEAVDKIKQHTRNFAKRQFTYFRSNKDIKLIDNYDEILEDLNIENH